MSTMKKTWIYVAGVGIFGLAYAWLKGMLPEPVFFAGAIAYLLLLRLAAEKFGK
jgi:hypothetical protein